MSQKCTNRKKKQNWVLWGYILPCAWLGKDWLGLVLVKNDRKNHFQTHWVLATYDWASALWLQQHSESAFLLGLPVQFHVGKPYFVTRFVFSRNVRNVHAVLGHDQWKTVHDNRRGGEEGQEGGGQYFLPVSPHLPKSAPVWPFFFGFTHLIQTNY